LSKASLLLASVFGVGYIRNAPGTFGSLAGLPVAYGVHLLAAHAAARPLADLSPTLIHIIAGGGVCVLLTALALIIIGRAEQSGFDHDDQRIVLDEVVGQTVALFAFPPNLLVYVLGFALFRFFDIWKPGPIGYIDSQWPGARGTLLDDVVAGIFSAFVLFLGFSLYSFA